MLPLLIALGAVGAVVLLVFLVIMLRELRGVARSVQRLNEDLGPLLAGIRTDAERARATLERLSEEGADLAGQRSRAGRQDRR